MEKRGRGIARACVCVRVCVCARAHARICVCMRMIFQTENIVRFNQDSSWQILAFRWSCWTAKISTLYKHRQNVWQFHTYPLPNLRYYVLCSLVRQRTRTPFLQNLLMYFGTREVHFFDKIVAQEIVVYKNIVF